MGYKIQYNTMGKKYIASRNYKPLIISICIIALFGTTYLLREKLYYLLPGDPEVTQDALSALIDNLSAGESFGEAITAFCQEVISGAL